MTGVQTCALPISPKILADIVESLAAAIYFDLNFDLQKLWVVRILLLFSYKAKMNCLFSFSCFGHLVSLSLSLSLSWYWIHHWLFYIWRSLGISWNLLSHLKSCNNNPTLLRYCMNCVKSRGGKLTLSSGGKGQRILLLYMSMVCLLPNVLLINLWTLQILMQQSKHCSSYRNLWPLTYRIEKEEGLNQYKKYVCSVQVPIDGGLSIGGEEKSGKKEAENSAASCIIRALLESNKI